MYTQDSPVTILYLETMIDQNILQKKLFHPLLLLEERMNVQQTIQLDHTSISTIQDAVQNLLQGSAIVFFKKNNTCLSFDVKKYFHKKYHGTCNGKSDSWFSRRFYRKSKCKCKYHAESNHQSKSDDILF
ncbi:spore germination protein [Bacillus cereus]